MDSIFFGKNLVFLRKKKGLTVVEIAVELDFKRTQWTNYETNLSHPKFIDLIKIAKYFDIDESVLIHVDIENSSPIKSIRPTLEAVLELIKKYKVTAYEIEKHTPLACVGVQKIIDRKTRKPTQRTLDIIHDYIKSAYENKHKESKTTIFEDFMKERDLRIKEKDVLIESRESEIRAKETIIQLQDDKIKTLESKMSELKKDNTYKNIAPHQQVAEPTEKLKKKK